MTNMIKVLYSEYEETPHLNGLLHKWITKDSLVFGLIQKENGFMVLVPYNFIKII